MTCYSPSQKLVYIHYPKAAGHSVTEFLRQTLPDLSNQHLTHRHHTLEQVNTLTGITDWACVLFVTRHPCAILVSRYHFWKQEYEQGRRYPHARLAHNHSFAEWLRHTDSEHGPYEFHQWYQSADPANLCIIDTKDLALRLPQVIAPYTSVDPLPKVKQLNSSSHRHWSHYYDANTMRLVQDRYSYTLSRYYNDSEAHWQTG